MSRFKLAAVALAISALVVAPLAFGAGYFPGFPIVGQAAYCTSISGVGNTAGTGQPSITGTPGQFGQGFPNQVGTANNGNFSSVCNVQAPAGPANVPSTALIPMDTELAQGQQPQTVLLPAVLTGSVALDVAPLTGASITVPGGVSQLVIDPAGTIAALTIVLPASTLLYDGQEFKASSTQTITALTVTAGSGTTIVSTAVTTLGATTAALDLIYHAATQKWTSG